MVNNMDSMLNQAPENKCRSLGWQCNVYSCYNTLCKTDASPSGLNLFRYSQANRAKIRWRNFSKTVDGMDDFIIKILCLPSRKLFTDGNIINGRTCGDSLEDLCHPRICTLLRLIRSGRLTSEQNASFLAKSASTSALVLKIIFSFRFHQCIRNRISFLYCSPEHDQRDFIRFCALY